MNSWSNEAMIATHLLFLSLSFFSAIPPPTMNYGRGGMQMGAQNERNYHGSRGSHGSHGSQNYGSRGSHGSQNYDRRGGGGGYHGSQNHGGGGRPWIENRQSFAGKLNQYLTWNFGG